MRLSGRLWLTVRSNTVLAQHHPILSMKFNLNANIRWCVTKLTCTSQGLWPNEKNLCDGVVEYRFRFTDSLVFVWFQMPGYFKNSSSVNFMKEWYWSFLQLSSCRCNCTLYVSISFLSYLSWNDNDLKGSKAHKGMLLCTKVWALNRVLINILS